jgi:hypothetical protein
MNIAGLIRIMEARLAALNGARASAAAVGDLAQIVSLDAQVEEAQATLTKLRTLPD